jgi:dihydroxyacetone kinase
MTSMGNHNGMKLVGNEDLVVVVNNLGGTTVMEEWIITREVINFLGLSDLPAKTIGLLGFSKATQFLTAFFSSIFSCVHSENIKEHKVVRAYCGRFMTALDMAGFTVTFFKLPRDKSAKEKLLKMFDEPTDAIAWPKILTEAPGDRLLIHC